ncbi:hypothetical protein HHI36_008446 [Cryptolaemus montrouzieri]|uniref:Mpv17-like protein 2 n=1 Tax=Cryptolaemus montrouzieri TaxID=559131 RepID=A0ABD2MSL9_9CUCU
MFKRWSILTSMFRKKTNLVQDYKHHAFGKYLLFTNITSSGATMFFGDLLQQELEYQQGKLSKRYDYGRLGRMLFIGLAVGPLHHYFYINLNKYIPGEP